ncbi:MAG: disulfide bond formation protein B [Patescibacteria group bacterium]
MLTLIPVLTLASHVIFVVALLAIIFRNSWGKSLTMWLGRHSLKLSFAVSLVAVIGSLFYSNVIGFPPCELCWWQRIFLYPTPIIFGVALLKKNASAFLYTTPLAMLAGIVAIYQAYVNLGGTSVLPCTAVGGECSKVFVLAFGYITIPMMSLTIVLYILLIAWAKKTYDDNSHT